MKATFKNIAFTLTIIALVIVVLSAVDTASSIDVNNSDTYLRITVLDLDEKPLHNAEITLCGETFLTDNKGLSPNIQLLKEENFYDDDITQWHTVNVVIKKEGYVPAVVLNCVAYDCQTRRLTVKLYQIDGSNLPYVCYVESPPNDYVKNLISK